MREKLGSKYNAPSGKWRMISRHSLFSLSSGSCENSPSFSPSVGVCAKLHGLTLTVCVFSAIVLVFLPRGETVIP